MAGSSRSSFSTRRIVLGGAAWLAAAGLVLSSCSSDSKVKVAETRVKVKERAVADARTAFETASAGFCSQAKDYIAAVDRYGRALTNGAATVGHVKAAGADLEAPRAAAAASAEKAVSAHEDLVTAEAELASAQASVADAKASASGSSTTTTAGSTTTTTSLVPSATMDRVKRAEANLATATQSITDETPLVTATVSLNSAAFAVEVTSLQLLRDAGCLSEDEQAKAQAAVRDYTIAVQNALTGTGYYQGEVDGIYGASTVEAVQKLQTASGLPATGLVDAATASALTTAMVSKGGAIAAQALAHTAAVQSTLKIAGYWSGPVNGQWTPELTEALQSFQTALGVPATGTVDTATLAAIETKVASSKEAATTTSTTSTTVPSTTTTSSK